MKKQPLSGLGLNDVQMRILQGLVDHGVYGDSIEDVVRYMIIREIDRLIGVQYLSKHAETMALLRAKP